MTLKKSTYLLEIGCEEIPSRFVPTLLSDLKSKVSQALIASRIGFSEIITLGTYRRLTLIINGLAQVQEDHNEEVVGPPVTIALDASGSPLPPAIGFAKKCQIDVSQLTTITKNGQNYIGFTRYEKGQLTESVLPTLIITAIKDLPLPIAMRWGSNTETFIRPIHWIVSLLDDKVIPITLFDIKADRFSYGHRLLTDNPIKRNLISGSEITLKDAADYESALKTHKVLVNQDDRKALIVTALQKEMDMTYVDSDTLDEVVYLVEWPTLIQGQFNPDYLTIPKEVLTQCIKKHQKYFPVIKNGEMTSQFWVAAENVTTENKATIIRGNQNVLTARLEDVKFFWEEDLKLKLDELTPKLNNIVFQKGLGSIKDKIDRMAKLADLITTDIKASKHHTDIQRTLTLCKADLVSHMVGELPELQGNMGAFYAKNQGETDLVSQGIQEHYMPRFAADSVPKSITGTVTALADKIDTTVASFYNGLIPTGSQDPWGIRRGVYGIAKILFESKLDVSIAPWIEDIYTQLGGPKNQDKLTTFITQRFQSFLEEKGLSQDSVQAALSVHGFHLLNAYHVAKQLDECRKNTPDQFKALIETAVRITRLAKSTPTGQSITPKLFNLPQETSAYEALKSLKKEIGITELIPLTEIMTEYFNFVLVMDKNPDIKANRLNFLSELSAHYTQVADFEKIVI